jgi:TatD DNase family protein
MIDFHCHLVQYPEPTKVIDECLKQGLYVLSMSNTPSEWQSANILISDKPRLRIALGLHPQLINKPRNELLDSFDRLINDTRYVGEIGLDGSSAYQQHMGDQITAFEHILSTCQNSGGKLMSIHSRSAARRVLESLAKYPNAGIPILHWFSGSMRELERAKELRCWFSVGPAMFQGVNAPALVQNMPRDRIITETDGPFTRYRRKTLMPWDVDIVEKEIAKCWRTTLSAVKEILRENALCILKS